MLQTRAWRKLVNFKGENVLIQSLLKRHYWDSLILSEQLFLIGKNYYWKTKGKRVLSLSVLRSTIVSL